MGLIATLLRPLVGTPIELPGSLVHAHPALAQVRYRRGGLAVRLGGLALGRSTVAAITLRRTVFVAPGVVLEPGLLLHELCHVRQFFETPAFPIRYLWESIRRGYHANRYEVEARRFAAAQLGRASAGGLPSQESHSG